VDVDCAGAEEEEDEAGRVLMVLIWSTCECKLDCDSLEFASEDDVEGVGVLELNILAILSLISFCFWAIMAAI
jgi:hypothetical protein